MLDAVVNRSHDNPRARAVDEIYAVLARFPLVIDLLKTMDASLVPLPGDADLQHGCERALTSMLAELSRIDPAPATTPVAREAILYDWLADQPTSKLVDADLLQRFQFLFDRILNGHPT